MFCLLDNTFKKKELSDEPLLESDEPLSKVSKKPLTEYGMQPYGPPCGSTISMQI